MSAYLSLRHLYSFGIKLDVMNTAFWTCTDKEGNFVIIQRTKMNGKIKSEGRKGVGRPNEVPKAILYEPSGISKSEGELKRNPRPLTA